MGDICTIEFFESDKSQNMYASEKQTASVAAIVEDKVVVEPVVDEIVTVQQKQQHERTEKGQKNVDDDKEVSTAVETISEEKRSHDEVEDKEIQEQKSRLSRAVTKLRSGVHNYRTIDPATIKDRYFTQEELQRLVKEAEAEIAIRKEWERSLLNSNEESDIVDTTPVTSVTDVEVALQEKLEAIEYQILDFDEKAKKGDSKAKEELGFLMVEQWQLLNNLFETQQKQNNQVIKNPMIGILMRILAIVTKVGVKAWVALNSPPNTPLITLRYHLVKKIEKASQPGSDGRVPRVSLPERLRIELTNPAAVAAEITQMQTMFSVKSGSAKREVV